MDGTLAEIETDGPPVRLPPRLVQPLARVFHELIANAREHGALAAASGTVSLDWSTAASAIDLHWIEDWDTDAIAPPRSGLGLELVRGVVCKQLASEVTIDWLDHGLDAVQNSLVAMRTALSGLSL